MTTIRPAIPADARLVAPLLDAAAAFGREKGALRLALPTARTNTTARAMYESQGWVRDASFHEYALKL